MGFCDSPSPPPAPDYTGAAIQQGVANKDTALVQGKINNPNVISPYGTQTTTWGTGTTNEGAFQTAQDAWRDKYTAWHEAGQQGAQPVAPTRAQFKSDINSPTITQTFSPQEQALYNQSNQIKQLLGGLGQQGAQSLQGVVGKPVDFSGAPQTGNYDDTRRTVINAMMSRANEDYGKQTDATRSNLLAAGIPMGSKAYGDQQQMIERSRNDARTQAEIAGGNAASQAYGMDEARRRQAITELLAQRQTPLNEINALMSGSQVSSPFQMPGYAQNTQVAQTPLYNALQAQGQYGTDVFNAQAAGASNQQSGLMGLGGTAILAGAMF